MTLVRAYKNTLTGLVLLCIILLCASAYLFFHDAAALHRAGYFSGPRGWHHVGTEQGSPDAAAIRAWMTFDFINDVFKLPPAYLQSSLAINSTSYPRITIRQAAKLVGISEIDYLLRAQNAVASYRTQP
jgi:hypothetical protein